MNVIVDKNRQMNDLINIEWLLFPG